MWSSANAAHDIAHDDYAQADGIAGWRFTETESTVLFFQHYLFARRLENVFFTIPCGIIRVW